MSEQKKGHSRRDFLLKTITLAPAMAVGSTAMGALSLPLATQAAETPATPQQARDYQPNWFTAEEFAFITAAVARLIPSDERGPGALEAGVPEFIDRQMNTPYATGSNWYMQGPFNPDLPKELGYQLPLVPQQIYRLGLADADNYSKSSTARCSPSSVASSRMPYCRRWKMAVLNSASCRQKSSLASCCRIPVKASSAILYTAGIRAWSAGS